MTQFKPKYITFDCYGTLTRFRMSDMAREMFADRINPDQMEQFVKDFAAYRLDEVLGAWKPCEHVILSNANNGQLPHNVKLLEAPFHAAYTAEDAQAYKPRLQAFEYMFDRLGCNPEDVLHVSSSLRYDLMSAHDIGIKNTVFVDRGHGPSSPYYDYHVIKDIGGLPGIVGL